MIVEKKIGFIFIEGFADWEFGILSASAVEWFSAKAFSITPDGKPVKSMSGFRLTPDRSAAPDRNADLDAVVVVGSDNWAGRNPPDVGGGGGAGARGARGGRPGPGAATASSAASAPVRWCLPGPASSRMSRTPATAVAGSWRTHRPIQARRITATCRMLSPMGR